MARIVVTGANRGIGLELARHLAVRGDEVVAACRSASPQLKALQVESHEGVDVTDEASVRRFAQAVAGKPVDILINNAGILSHETLEDLDFDRMRRQFEVNALGPLRVTAALLAALKKGSKVAIITSRMGSLADNTSGGAYGYRASKAAASMIGVSLARDLKPKGISVVILHPGYVRTEMTGRTGMVEPADAAANLIARIDELTLQRTGQFLHAEGAPLPW
ncbi:MAG: SDR family oxidoreductase [Hyphomicrobiales bacterium]|nr:SDR family oxidoreductase [Hyphomicrobiales bacterium]